MRHINVLTVTFHTRDLIKTMIKSFDKFKPADLKITYVVVENSIDTSYKAEILELSENIVWLNHEAGEKHQSSLGHGMAYELGKKYCKQDLTFVCHSDTCVTSPSFFKSFLELFLSHFRVLFESFSRHFQIIFKSFSNYF